MSGIKLACETYTWQMPGEQYKGKLEHIMKVCSQAGFAGIEPESSFLKQLEDPFKMKDALTAYDLDLAVLCIVEDWLHTQETEEERNRANQWISFLGHFPETILLTVQMPGSDRENLRERQQNMISSVNDLSRRAAERGIVCSNHPNSPDGSVFRIESDYEILMEGLDEEATGFCPDLGHIAKGGMDPLELVQRYRSRINLVHYKDMFHDGRWAATGMGSVDLEGVTSYLVASGYSGWIVMEDECDEAIKDPDGLTLRDGEYIDRVLKPLLK
jgi:inosose dehydratase